MPRACLLGKIVGKSVNIIRISAIFLNLMTIFEKIAYTQKPRERARVCPGLGRYTNLCIIPESVKEGTPVSAACCWCDGLTVDGGRR